MGNPRQWLQICPFVLMLMFSLIFSCRKRGCFQLFFCFTILLRVSGSHGVRQVQDCQMFWIIQRVSILT